MADHHRELSWIQKFIRIMLVLVVALLLVVATISVRRAMFADDFKLISIGEARARVIKQLGEPDIDEFPQAPFLRYAVRGCQDSCVERLWYEKGVIGLEAWSVEIGRDGAVLQSDYWTSP